ncbi:hypothetical protein Q5752_006230 [Cryptotrichosporon argae]
MPGLIDPRYCCCAVPLVNAGIYFVLAEQAAVALATGVLAVGGSDVAGAAIPSYTVYILAALCFLVTAMQPAGFIGVLREKTTLFRLYSTANAALVAASMACAAALVAVSAARHTTAVASCEQDYFSSSNATSSSTNATLASEGEALCSAFAWADIGCMGAIWLILLVTQGYFIYLTRTYSVSQVSDHKLYHSVYDENPEAFTMSILRSTRYNPGSVYNLQPPAGPGADAWDARPSFESVHESAYGAGGQHGAHRRGPSNLSNVRASAYAYDDQRGGGGYVDPDQSFESQQHAYDHGAEPAPGPGPGAYEPNRMSRYEDAYHDGAHAYPNDAAGYAHGYGHPQAYDYSTPHDGYGQHDARYAQH